MASDPDLAMADGAKGITVLICTHNRADLLERAIASLNAAERSSALPHESLPT